MWLGIFGQLPGGPVPLVTRGAAVLVLCAARLAGLVTPALSQPLSPDPWASELCPFQPACSSPGVKRLPTKPGWPGKLGAPGLGLERPAHWDWGPVGGGGGRQLWAELGGRRDTATGGTGKHTGLCMYPVSAWTLPRGPRNRILESRSRRRRQLLCPELTDRREPSRDSRKVACAGPVNASSDLHCSDQLRWWD